MPSQGEQLHTSTMVPLFTPFPERKPICQRGIMPLELLFFHSCILVLQNEGKNSLSVSNALPRH